MSVRQVNAISEGSQEPHSGVMMDNSRIHPRGTLIKNTEKPCFKELLNGPLQGSKHTTEAKTVWEYWQESLARLQDAMKIVDETLESNSLTTLVESSFGTVAFTSAGVIGILDTVTLDCPTLFPGGPPPREVLYVCAERIDIHIPGFLDEVRSHKNRLTARFLEKTIEAYRSLYARGVIVDLDDIPGALSPESPSTPLASPPPEDSEPLVEVEEHLPPSPPNTSPPPESEVAEETLPEPSEGFDFMTSLLGKIASENEAIDSGGDTGTFYDDETFHQPPSPPQPTPPTHPLKMPPPSGLLGEAMSNVESVNLGAFLIQNEGNSDIIPEDSDG